MKTPIYQIGEQLEGWFVFEQYYEDEDAGEAHGPFKTREDAIANAVTRQELDPRYAQGIGIMPDPAGEQVSAVWLDPANGETDIFVGHPLWVLGELRDQQVTEVAWLSYRTGLIEYWFGN
jgi:hypothetical protein